MDRSKCLFAVTNCTIEDALWRKIARTITTPSQRQSSWTYSRTDKFDRASSVFEPEPYGALPGIEEVLFNTEITTIEACLKRLEGKQDEEATRNTGEGERQQDWSQRVRFWASVEAIAMILTAVFLDIPGPRGCHK